MADNNMQPGNNEPLENEQWKEQGWQEKMDYAKTVVARQQAEAEQAELAAAQEAEAAEEAEEEGSLEDQEAEWAARLALAKGAARTGAGESGTPDEEDEKRESIIKELDALDKQIAELDKKTGNEYVTIYMFLTTGAAVVDLLQAIADVTFILALIASASGITFSVIRHYGLKMANPNATSAEHQQVLRRTLISGAVSMIPYVDMLPEQTAFMLREWTIRRESISETKDEIDKLKTKRKKLAASLPK